MAEAFKQRAATGRIAEMFEGLSSELKPLPAYEAPDELNARAQGWLKHLHRKATTPDDWSSTGVPHAWWDRYTSAPMMNFPRFDLQESAYAMALMADRTPAWREVYAETLDGLVQRYHQHWAAVDWLNQFGDDPDRGSYPGGWNGALIPSDHWGDYNTPGWTANGTNPYPTKEARLAAPFCESSDEYIQPVRNAALFESFFTLKRSFYQDRLGTNIGKASTFFSGPYPRGSDALLQGVDAAEYGSLRACERRFRKV